MWLLFLNSSANCFHFPDALLPDISGKSGNFPFFESTFFISKCIQQSISWCYNIVNQIFDNFAFFKWTVSLEPLPKFLRKYIRWVLLPEFLLHAVCCAMARILRIQYDNISVMDKFAINHCSRMVFNDWFITVRLITPLAKFCKRHIWVCVWSITAAVNGSG